jgi:hypothetical protein
VADGCTDTAIFLNSIAVAGAFAFFPGSNAALQGFAFVAVGLVVAAAYRLVYLNTHGIGIYFALVYTIGAGRGPLAGSAEKDAYY